MIRSRRGMQNKNRNVLSIIGLLLFFPSFASAHGTGTPDTTPSIDSILSSISLTLALAAFGVLIGLIVVAILLPRATEQVKRFLFLSIAALVIATTLVLAGSTVWLNLNSWSGGPIHWHADFSVIACGKELDLVDPEGFANRTGTATRHEHNDQRLHYEGVVVEEEDAELGNFLRDIGIILTDDELEFPTNEGVVDYHTGDSCPDGSIGEVQVFTYQTDRLTNTFHQQKLDNFTSYIIAAEGQVPPGDCLIVEFSTPKERTDHLCQSYEAAYELGKLKGEIRGPRH